MSRSYLRTGCHGVHSFDNNSWISNHSSSSAQCAVDEIDQWCDANYVGSVSSPTFIDTYFGLSAICTRDQLTHISLGRINGISDRQRKRTTNKGIACASMTIEGTYRIMKINCSTYDQFIWQTSVYLCVYENTNSISAFFARRNCESMRRTSVRGPTKSLFA